MNDDPRKCLYCSQWVKGDLWMAVHIERAHADLMSLYFPDRRDEP